MARRANKQFIVTLMVTVLGLAMAALVIPRFIKPGRGDPKKLIAEGDRLMAASQFDKAQKTYAKAHDADPTSTEALLKLGDASAKLVDVDPENLRAAFGAWWQAYNVDPRCVPAINRLLDAHWDYIDVGSQAEERAALFGKVRLLADKLLAINSDDKRAAARKHIATIRQWIATSTVSETEVNRSIAAMQDLMRKDPGNAELPTWIAQAKLRQAQEKLDTGQAPLAQQLFIDIVAMFEQATKDQPNNGTMHYRAYQAYAQLDKTDPRTKDDDKDDRYAKRAEAEIDAAERTATDKDDHYDDIQVTAADYYGRRGDILRAREIVKAFYDAHPGNQQARLAMARVFAADKSTRDQAIALLSKEVPEDKTATGFKLLFQRELQARTVYDLATLRLDEYAAAVDAKDAERRKQLEPLIGESIDKLKKMSYARAYHVRALQGRLHWLKGENIDAVKALDEAVRNMGATPDYDIMFTAARAYLRNGQPGPAKGLLERIVTGTPDAVPARLLLAGQLADGGDFEGSKRHLNVLVKQAPNEAQVHQLDRLLKIISPENASQREILFRQLEEKTPDQRFSKAKVAEIIEKPDEAIRLLKDNLANDNLRATLELESIYETRGQIVPAKQVVRDGLQVNPGDMTLTRLLQKLENAKPEQSYAQLKPLIEKIADPAKRELEMFKLEYAPGGHRDQALGHLEHANQLRPGDREILMLLSSFYAELKEWAKAEATMNELARTGADPFGGASYQQRMAMAKGDFAGAEKLGQQLTKAYPEVKETWLGLARAQQALGQFDQAAKSFQEVRRRQDNHYEAIRGLADCYYQLDKPKEAKAQLVDGRRLFPADAAIQELYLDHIVNYENPEDAIKETIDLLDKHREDPNYHMALASVYYLAARHLTLSDIGKHGAYLNKARDVLLAGRTKFPDNARFYAQIAELLWYAGQVAKGEEVLKEYAGRESVRDKPAGYVLLADYYMRAQDLEKAEQSLGDALRRADATEQLEVRLRLAAVLTKREKYKAALDTLNGIKNDDDLRVVVQRAETLIAASDLKSAEAELDKALVKQDSPALRCLKAQILIDTGRVPAALVQLQAATRLDPRNEFTRYLHALALSKQAEPDYINAIKELKEVSSRNPSNLQVRGLLAELYATANKLPAAISELDETLRRKPQSKDIRLALIRLYRMSQPPNYDAARKLAQDAQLDPVLKRDAAWPREEAICYLGQKKIAEAIFAIDKSIFLDPGNAGLKREKLDMLLQMNDFDAVLRESDKMLAGHVDTWWLHHQRGLAFAKRVDPDNVKAVASFDRALKLADDAHDAYTAQFVLRGMAATVVRQDGDRVIPVGNEEAVKRIGKERLANDLDNEWHLLVAALLRGQGDFPAAQSALEALLNDPANKAKDRRIPILRAAADAYHHAPKRNIDRAADMYKQLLALDPEDLPALNNIAYLLAEDANDPNQAKQHSAKAYNLTRSSGLPNDMILDTHGWVLVLSGGTDGSEGLNILKTVVQHQPDFQEGRYHLAEAYFRQATLSNGFYGQAYQELKTLLAQIDKIEKTGGEVDKDLKSKIRVLLDKVETVIGTQGIDKK